MIEQKLQSKVQPARGLDDVDGPARAACSPRARARRRLGRASGSAASRATGRFGVVRQRAAPAVREAGDAPRGRRPPRARAAARGTCARPRPAPASRPRGSARTPRARGSDRTRRPRCARAGRGAGPARAMANAVARWKVITDRPTTSGCALAHQPLDGRRDAALDEHEVGDGDLVMRIDVAGERRERAVRHPDGDRRHVLERVRHRQQEHPHAAKLTMISATFRWRPR